MQNTKEMKEGDWSQCTIIENLIYSTFDNLAHGEKIQVLLFVLYFRKPFSDLR